MIKRFQYLLSLGLIVFSVLVVSGGADASIAVNAGAKCSKSGAVSVSNKVSYVCTKVGGKLVWKARTSSVVDTTITTTVSSGVTQTTTASLAVAQTIGKIKPSPLGATSGGPWETRMVLSVSTDGITFTGREVVMDQAGVPNIVVGSDGTIYSYYADWANGGIMGVAIKNTSGTWSRYKLSIEGIQTNYTPCGACGVDPSAVVLSDGRIRVFWMQRLNGNRIYSATSSLGIGNGFIFKFDGGFAFETTKEIYDPTVVQTATGWSMWVNIAASPTVEGTPTLLMSTDGLSFNETSSRSMFVASSVFPWGAARTPSGTIRLMAQNKGLGGAFGVIYESTNGGVSYIQLASGKLPSGASPDAGIAYDSSRSIWYLVYLETM